MSDTILLAEKVAKEMERLIEEGQFLPGEKLPSEGLLTEQFHVGRSTLREAMKVLKTKRVLESRRGIGTFVCAEAERVEDVFSLAEVANTVKNKLNVLEIRLLLEPEAAAMAAVNATEEQIAQLKRQCTVVERLMLLDQDYSRADSLLHQQIAESSGNAILSQLLAVIASSEFMNISSTNDECREHSMQCHRAVVDSISRRDVQGARYNMVHHIGYSRSFLLENLDQDVLDPGILLKK
jgi:GntR family transcriptional repressor for pyruvate dehydrogenase complex